MIQRGGAWAAGAALLLGLLAAVVLFSSGGSANPAAGGRLAPAQATATVPAASTVTAPITATGTPTGTTFDPYQLLQVFEIIPPSSELVKETIVDLIPGEPREVLLTISARVEQTGTTAPADAPAIANMLAVRYNGGAGGWQTVWQAAPSELPGQAVALPDTTGVAEVVRPYQGGDLLRTGQPILLLRTYEAPTAPGTAARVTLRLWAWTGETAVPLRMVPPDGPPQDAVFTGSSDVQTADLDDDGVIEVLVDSGPTTTIYRWDAAARQFVVRP